MQKKNHQPPKVHQPPRPTGITPTSFVNLMALKDAKIEKLQELAARYGGHLPWCFERPWPVNEPTSTQIGVHRAAYIRSHGDRCACGWLQRATDADVRIRPEDAAPRAPRTGIA